MEDTMPVDMICPLKIDGERRINLFKQTLQSLIRHTSPLLVSKVVFVDDGSDIVWQDRIFKFLENEKAPFEIEFIPFTVRRGVGGSKNYSIESLKDNRSKYLYIFDNDVYFTKGWLTTLINSYEAHRDTFKVLAGGVHPFLQPRQSESLTDVTSHDALSGWSWLMDYEVWDKYGKLADNALGTGQSEDWEYCQRIRNDGFLVGCVQPQVVAHCGLTNTEGMPIVGFEESKKLANNIAKEAILI